MKIAILCNGLNHIQRGAEKFSTEIYNLLKKDYEIELLGVKDTHTKTRNQFKLPWRNGKAYLESYYFGKEIYNGRGNSVLWKPDLIINNAGFPGSYWCNKIRKLKGIPFITLERGGGREEKINHLFKPDKMVYLTKYSMNQSKYKRKSHIPIGINVAEYQKKRKPPSFIKHLERPIYLSTSALVGFKRIPLLIDAISRTGGTLIQTSDGSQRKSICEYGDKKLGKRFFYIGKVPRDELLSLYQHSDCFVSASKHEAFGIVFIESLSSNLPIIAQADSRRREIIGEGGFLTDFSNESYCDQVFQDCDKSILKPLKQAEKFDWKVLKPKYIELIEEVAG